ncbi:MAG: GGDEF domain-containing protein [Pseudobdellovibrionaceae bacterium]|nr:GGDEF domain-containing protein [Bdellovibrionales bacterium]USN49053.1 MAG: GGDEF domain-containing protein [Pseudobdellovibrionaceae bacterium]
MSDDDKQDDEITQDKTSIVQSDTFKMRVAQANQAPPSLLLLVGPASAVGRQWPIEDTGRVVGRDVNSHIYVDDRSVSKAHAKLVLSGGEVSIIDLESTNKTVVNRAVLSPLTPCKLSNNDQIKMGNVIFKFLERGNIETVSAAQTFDRGHTDALTGINNRTGLYVRGTEMFKRSRLLGIPFTVITFDIDHFKKTNDTYLHTGGDFVLKELSHVIRDKLIREDDFFARSGGEEFCLLLLGSPLDRAKEIAERIRATIEHHEFNFEGQIIPVTISVGVSLSEPTDQTWEDTFERADKALYASKGSGRNRVTVAPI